MSRSAELGTPRRIELSTGPLAYRERGDGRPIVFLHGLLVNGDLWRKVVPPLAGEFRCLTPDWPLGAHETPLAPGVEPTVERIAELVAEFLEALDLRDVVLVANDTGGAIAQLVMTRQKERLGAVVLTPCDCFDNFLPPAFRPLQRLAAWPRLFRALMQPLRLGLVQRSPIAFGWLMKGPIDRDTVAGWVSPMLDDEAVLRDVCATIRSISPRLTLEAADRLKDFDRPVLLAWTKEDRFFPPVHAERMAAILPDARISWIEDSYTFVSEDQPDVLAREIAAFAR